MILDVLREHSSVRSDALALFAPGRKPLSYGGLVSQIERTVEGLNGSGIGRGDRVALVLPDGPEIATAFLSVASAATCAPLNPRYRAEEFDFYLSDLKAKAVLTPGGVDSPVRAVAAARGIRVIDLYPLDDGPAGAFRLQVDAEPAPRPSFAFAADVALVLHTSGTTSRPKVVPLTHANLLASARHIRATLGLTPADRCLNVMPLFHIHGLVGALLSSLIAGAQVVCAPGFQAPIIFDWLEEFRPSWYSAVPTMHQAILARTGQNREKDRTCGLRFIRSSSAALAPSVMSELESTFGVPVIESYGMTEASHQMASNPLPPRVRKPGSVGLPAGPAIAILDEAGTLLSPGIPGEIAIQGSNVTSGYENNPAANENAFINGWFRTGDQGYLDRDGYLFLTGRLKEIINRAGEKISPREIDEALLEHPSVAQAVAFAMPDKMLGEDVGAAVVLRPDRTATESELREFVSRRLADFKTPRRILFVSEIPKGPSGKLQRIGLAEKLGLTASDEQTVQRSGYSAPKTDTERRLCDIWQELLRVERAGAEDNFFHLGGDSVMAAQFLARLREEFNVQLPLVRFFESPTVASTAAWLLSASQVDGGIAAPVKRRPDPGRMPASPAQHTMWLVDQFEPEPASLNRPGLYLLRGVLDVEALENSLKEIVRRHEALRTVYPSRNGELVVSLVDAESFQLPLIDLTPMAEGEPLARVQQLAKQEGVRRFDLAVDLMFRAMLFRTAPEEHFLVVVMHHIASDGWSDGVFFTELAALYQGFLSARKAVLAPLEIQYADFAYWTNEWLTSSAFDEQLEYWKKRLAGLPPLCTLPTDHPRPARRTGRGALESLILPRDLHDRLTLFSREQDATLFMTLLTAFQVLLCRYSRSEDVVVGCPLANRPTSAVESLIGLFMNPLPLRLDLSGNPTFRTALARARESAVGAYANGNVPFNSIVKALPPERTLGHTPVYQVLFQLRNLPSRSRALPGLEIEEVTVDWGVGAFDLTVDITEVAEGLRCRMLYKPDLYDAPTIQRVLEHYQALLESAVNAPDHSIHALPMFKNQAAIVTRLDSRPPAQTVSVLFQAQVERTPEATALIFEGERWTYRELNEHANRVARLLRRLGVGPEVIVGVFLERSPHLIAALLGVMKTGGAYLPLNPEHPPARLETIVDDAAPPVILTWSDLLRRLPGTAASLICLDAESEAIRRESAADLPGASQIENAAYVIYTSGSTGRPNGVVVPHSALSNLLLALRDDYSLGPEDRVLQKTPFSFDGSISEIFGALIAGATLVLARPGGHREPAYLAQLIEEHRITTVDLVPSIMPPFLELDEVSAKCRSLKRMFTGGEGLPRATEKRYFERLEAELYNQYGPTEATVYVTHWKCRPGETGQAIVPIGRPIAGTQAHILDDHLRQVAMGVTGEICIGGASLARGYLNRPELTAERFIPSPFGEANGARLFRTGDLGRRQADGTIEFLGRRDDQVKIRGFRIELGEVEAALGEHPAVNCTAVLFYEHSASGPSLAAYIVLKRGSPASADDLRSYLGRILPDYMVPSAFVFLERLPVTPNGKIDRRALPSPEASRPECTNGYVAPRDALELQLAKIWEGTLGVHPIGVNDNFFSLGGHSLSAITLFSKTEKVTGKSLPLATLIEAPTIAALAQILRDNGASPSWRSLVALQPGGSKPPLFCMHAQGGQVFFYHELARSLGADQPVYGVQAVAGEDDRAPASLLEAMCARYVAEVRKLQPEGPYYLAGYCAGAYVALEMARQIEDEGQRVGLVIDFNTDGSWRRIKSFESGLRYHLRNLKSLSPRLQLLYLRRRLEFRIRRVARTIAELAYQFFAKAGISAPEVLRRTHAWELNFQASRAYRPRPIQARIVYFHGTEDPHKDPKPFWTGLAGGGLEIHDVPGSDIYIFDKPNVSVLAAQLKSRLEKAYEEDQALTAAAVLETTSSIT